jgi:hypothetical protein
MPYNRSCTVPGIERAQRQWTNLHDLGDFADAVPGRIRAALVHENRMGGAIGRVSGLADIIQPPVSAVWEAMAMNSPLDFERVRGARRRTRLERLRPAVAVLAAAALIAGSARPAMAGLDHWQNVPEAIGAPGETLLLEVHAEGAQIYECKADAEGGLAWVLREPIASLFLNDKTVGRHYAGPRWEFSDGGSVSGKVVGKSPGDGPADIPWLKLAASDSGRGALAGVTTIQRINTRGGALDGNCETAGTFRSVPYSADYVFLKK